MGPVNIIIDHAIVLNDGAIVINLFEFFLRELFAILCKLSNARAIAKG